MAAKLTQVLEDQVKCPICLQQYEDPRILPCRIPIVDIVYK
ncbi:hypothetical protein QZH41_006971, partial [Actinostola sp. cb2023]